MKRVLFVLLILTACSGELEKEVVFDDFTLANKITINVPKNLSVSNVNVYISGQTTDSLYFSSLNNDTIYRFLGNDAKEVKLFEDFYGGQYQLIILPSNAEGKIKVKLEIPYHKP